MNHQQKADKEKGTSLMRSGHPVMFTAGYMVRRSALLVPRSYYSIWFHGEAPEDFGASEKDIHALKKKMLNCRPVFTSGRLSTYEWLSSKFTNDTVVPLPWSNPLSLGRFFSCIRPRGIVAIGSLESIPRAVLLKAGRREIPLVVLHQEVASEKDARHISNRLLGLEKYHIVVTRPRASTYLEDAGIPGERITIPTQTAGETACYAGPISTDNHNISGTPLEPLDPILPRIPAEDPVKQSWRVRTIRDRFGQSRLWRWAAAFFMKGRMDDWERLRSRLGYPRAILCLGNGPSSEDPALEGITYDCLFRVNWLWQRRGIFMGPDMVIVGDPRTVYRVPSCIYGFLSIEMELGMLLRRLITRGPGMIEYVTFERISSIIRDGAWTARPTSGALMIVAAAALQPDRLIIGGVDLYLHPQGRYPGDVSSDNSYAMVHSRRTEIEIIKQALAAYHGELVIVSDILRDSLGISP